MLRFGPLNRRLAEAAGSDPGRFSDHDRPSETYELVPAGNIKSPEILFHIMSIGQPGEGFRTPKQPPANLSRRFQEPERTTRSDPDLTGKFLRSF